MLNNGLANKLPHVVECRSCHRDLGRFFDRSPSALLLRDNMQNQIRAFLADEDSSHPTRTFALDKRADLSRIVTAE